MKRFLALAMLVLIGVPACTGRASPESATINGLKASDFYAQFKYRPEGELHHCLLSTDTPLATLPEGELSYHVDLYLLDDKSFVLRYGELLSRADGTGQTRNKQVLRGAWSVEKEELILENVGRAEGLSIDGKAALRLTLETQPGALNVRNKAALLFMGVSNRGPE